MNISVVELTNYIKFQLSTGEHKDPVVNTITDEEIDVLIKIHCGTLGLEYPEIPYSYMQLMSCYIRKELYWKLATVNAPLFDLKVEETELHKNQRFEHYLYLLQEVKKEIEDIMKDPSRLPEGFSAGGRITSHTTLIEKDYALRGYVNSQKIPKVKIKVDNIIPNEGVELSLDLSKVSRTDYIRTNVYLNEQRKILDEYSLNSILSEGTKLKYQTYNINKGKVRIPCKFEDNAPTKYILLEVELKYQLKAYYEIEVTI